MYNPKSRKAEEFINHDEVLASLKYADENKNNVELIDKILEKAKLGKGLSHREAAVLLDCEIEEKNKEIFELAEKIKKMFEELNDSKKVMILQEDDHDKKKLEDLYPPIMNEKKINSILGVPNQEDSEIKNPYDSQYPGQLATFECYTV